MIHFSPVRCKINIAPQELFRALRKFFWGWRESYARLLSPALSVLPLLMQSWAWAVSVFVWIVRKRISLINKAIKSESGFERKSLLPRFFENFSLGCADTWNDSSHHGTWTVVLFKYSFLCHQRMELICFSLGVILLTDIVLEEVSAKVCWQYCVAKRTTARWQFQHWLWGWRLSYAHKTVQKCSCMTRISRKIMDSVTLYYNSKGGLVHLKTILFNKWSAT